MTNYKAGIWLKYGPRPMLSSSYSTLVSTEPGLPPGVRYGGPAELDSDGSRQHGRGHGAEGRVETNTMFDGITLAQHRIAASTADSPSTERGFMTFS
jgi:hypothetical protein